MSPRDLRVAFLMTRKSTHSLKKTSSYSQIRKGLSWDGHTNLRCENLKDRHGYDVQGQAEDVVRDGLKPYTRNKFL